MSLLSTPPPDGRVPRVLSSPEDFNSPIQQLPYVPPGPNTPHALSANLHAQLGMMAVPVPHRRNISSVFGYASDESGHNSPLGARSSPLGSPSRAGVDELAARAFASVASPPYGRYGPPVSQYHPPSGTTLTAPGPYRQAQAHPYGPNLPPLTRNHPIFGPSLQQATPAPGAMPTSQWNPNPTSAPREMGLLSQPLWSSGRPTFSNTPSPLHQLSSATQLSTEFIQDNSDSDDQGTTSGNRGKP